MNKILLFLLLAVNITSAQYLYNMENLGHNPEGGYPQKILKSSENYYFMLFNNRSLILLRFEDNKFHRESAYPEHNDVNDIAKSPDGKIYLVSRSKIYLANYNGSEYSAELCVNTNERLSDIIIDENENIYAGYDEGVRKYVKNGSSYSLAAELHREDSSIQMALHNDYLFVIGKKVGLTAYKIKETEFERLAEISGSFPGYTVEVSQDGTLFYSDKMRGLVAGTFDGNNFTEKDRIYSGNAMLIWLSPDGRIFYANSWSHFGSCRYENGSLVDNVLYDLGNIGLMPISVEFMSNNKFCFINNQLNLGLYNYHDTNYSKIRWQQFGGYTVSLAASDNYIYSTNQISGIRIHDMGDTTLSHPIDFVPAIPADKVFANSDNYVVTEYDDHDTPAYVNLYKFNGSEMTKLDDLVLTEFYDLLITDDNLVYVMGHHNGISKYIYLYDISNNNFNAIDSLEIGDTYQGGITNYKDNIVFITADGQVMAIRNNGTSLEEIAYKYDFTGKRISANTDGLVAVMDPASKGFLYQFTGSKFELLSEKLGKGIEVLVTEDNHIFMVGKRILISTFGEENLNHHYSTGYSHDNNYDLIQTTDGDFVVAEGRFGIKRYRMHRTPIVIDVDEEEQIVEKFSLSQNYPNPFNPTTTLKFGLPVKAKVVLDIYNVLGEKVSTLIQKDLEAGIHTTTFNAVNLPSGIYFYNITATGEAGQNFSQTKKMLLVK